MSTDYTHLDKLSFDQLFARKGPGQEVQIMDSDGNLSGIGNITTTGTLSVASLNVTGALSVNSLAVTGSSSLSSMSVSDSSSLTTLNVSGSSTLASVSVTGNANLTSATITDTDSAGSAVLGVNLTATEAINGTNSGTLIAASITANRNITTSQSDASTASIEALGLRVGFTVPLGQTLTRSGNTTTALRFRTVTAPAGTLAIAVFSKIRFDADSTVTGARKTHILFNGAPSAATTGNAYMADNSNFTGDYFIHSSSALPSVLGGTLTAPGYIGVSTTSASQVGAIGETVESQVITPTTWPGGSAGSGVWGNLTTLALPSAGKWKIEAQYVQIPNGAGGIGQAAIAISLNSGTTTTDQVSGVNQLDLGTGTAQKGANMTAPIYQVSGPTTIYFKANLIFTSGFPTYQCYAGAVRVG